MAAPTIGQSEKCAAVGRALESVLDPCSVFNGARMSFVELGMIDAIDEPRPGEIVVRLFLDDPICFYLPDIRAEIVAAACSVPGVERATITVVGDRLWTSDEMSPEGRRKADHWQRIRALRARDRARPRAERTPKSANPGGGR